MNSETQTTSVPSHCEAQLVAANPQPSTGSSRRRTGKIATLPKSSRTRLNQMLEDGLPYAIIIKSLGRDGKRLTENNLSDWHKGGYQDWLKEQEWLDDMRARHELSLNLIRENRDCKIHEATLLIAATVISDLLKNLDPTSLSRSLKDEPLALIRLLNSLSRLSHHGIKCERQREQDVERKASSDQFRSSLKAAGIIA